MISVIIVLYLTNYSYHNLLKELSNHILLTTYLLTTSSILYSVPISNIILLKLLFSPFMTISSKLRVIKKSIVSLFLTFLLLLTL